MKIALNFHFVQWPLTQIRGDRAVVKRIPTFRLSFLFMKIKWTRHVLENMAP